MSEILTGVNPEIAKVLDFWREFDLDGKRLILDKHCLEMREFKSNSVAGRKRLNDITKSFRSKTKEEQLGMMTEVLKAYQEEIDQLSRRSKFSEASFHALYKAIYEAPDPVSTIDILLMQIASTSTHQLEIERLKGELSSYEQEFRQLKNQDITIRRLEEQLQEFKENFEERLNSALGSRLSELEEKADQRVNEVRDGQRTVEKRLAVAVEAMRQSQLQAERAQSALFEASQQHDIRVSALMAENSLLAESADRAQSRCEELERDMENLRALFMTSQQSAQGSSIVGGGGKDSHGAGEGNWGDDRVQTLQLVVTEMQAEARKRDEVNRAEKQRLEAALRETTSGLAAEKEASTRLRQELSSRPTREELGECERQLIVLQRIAFNVKDEDDHDEEIAGDPERTISGEGAHGHKHSRYQPLELEALLTARLKELEAQQTEARRKIEALQTLDGQNKKTIQALQSSLASSHSLVARLEADLEAQTRAVAGSFEGGDIRQKPRQGDLGLTELLLSDGDSSNKNQKGKSIASLSPAISAAKEPGHGKGMEKLDMRGAQVQPQSAAASNQMTTILQAQRDRYKERLAEAEARVLTLQQELSDALQSKEALETDNVALFGKIRYLQSFASGAHNSNASVATSRYAPPYQNTSGRAGGGSSSAYSRDIEQQQSHSADADVETKYRALYESRINPFQQFSQQERQRKLTELSVADRIVLNTTAACVSTHTGRSIVLIYLVCLHLLVFLTLYHTVHYHRPAHADCPAPPPCPTTAIAQGAVDMLLSSAMKEAATRS